MTASEPGTSRIPKEIWILGFVSLLMDISSEMIHGLLPLFMVTVLGTSTLAVGIVEGLAEATAALTKVFSGALSDRLGRRKGLTALGYGLAALSKPIFPLAGSIGWVIGARFIDRIGKGIREAPRDALIADLTPVGARGASYGLRQSLDTIGAFVGPLLAMALMLATANSFRTVFWIALIPAVLSFLLILLFVHEPEPHARAEPNVVSAPWGRLVLGRRFWLVVAVAALFMLARFSEAFLVLRAQSVGLPIALAPAVFVVMNIVYAMAAYPAGSLSDRGDRKSLLAVGMGLLMVADILLAFAQSLAPVALGVILWGAHLGLTQGLFSAQVADTAPADRRGVAFGIYNVVSGLTLLGASVLAGALWDAAGPKATFLFGAGFALLALAGLQIVVRANRTIETE